MRHPGGAARAIQQRVEQRPVGDRVRAVFHRFGFAVGRGDGAGIQMIAADDDRRFQFAARHHLVEREADAIAVAQSDPADARRQALEADALARHVEPVDADACRPAAALSPSRRSCRCLPDRPRARPAERPDAAAEQRADIGGHKARKIERVGHAFVLRHLADVVAVIDGGNAHACEKRAWRAHAPPWIVWLRCSTPSGSLAPPDSHSASVQPFGR